MASEIKSVSRTFSFRRREMFVNDSPGAFVLYENQGAAFALRDGLGTRLNRRDARERGHGGVMEDIDLILTNLTGSSQFITTDLTGVIFKKA